MRIHVLQHVEFEGLGSIRKWLEGKNATVTHTRFFAGECLPEPGSIDFLIVLGGPMSVNDEDRYPWLKQEKAFIARAIGKNKPMLGICLGSQLIACALGAKVYANREKEIGWFPVYALHKPIGAFHFPRSFDAFHWHGETFDLPKDSHLLAGSTACQNQAFQHGRRIIGLQFHLEATPESVAKIIDHCEHELLPERFVQSKAELTAVSGINYRIINAFMEQILDYLTAPNQIAA